MQVPWLTNVITLKLPELFKIQRDGEPLISKVSKEQIPSINSSITKVPSISNIDNPY